MNQTDQRAQTKMTKSLLLVTNRHAPTKQYDVLKRGMDILLSIVGIIIFFPLFILVGILLKWSDRKSVIFFKQTRVGKDEKPFEMYKFRTMISNAEDLLPDLMDQNEISGAMFKMKEDPRVTKLGRILRKTSIDELPQLWNVLKGEMSLVGPRPPLPHEVKQYTAYDKQRLQVIPGCTGLWQVSGRNRLGFNEMVELDLMYIQQKGVWMDMKIIFKTFLVLFGSNNAF